MALWIRKVDVTYTNYEVWDDRGNKPAYIVDRGGNRLRTIQADKPKTQEVEGFRPLTEAETSLFATLQTVDREED